MLVHYYVHALHSLALGQNNTDARDSLVTGSGVLDSKSLWHSARKGACTFIAFPQIQ